MTKQFNVVYRRSFNHAICLFEVKAARYKVVEDGALSGYLNLYREGEDRPFVTFPRDSWFYIERVGD